MVTIPGDFLYRYYNIGEKEVNSRVEILHAHEGVECITTVHRYPDGNRVISTGSINVAGTDLTLRTTQKLQAHIPMLLHPDPKVVLQVGFGSGETSHILTTYNTDQVDIVEISSGVIETSANYFSDLNHGVVGQPAFLQSAHKPTQIVVQVGYHGVILCDGFFENVLCVGQLSFVSAAVVRTDDRSAEEFNVFTQWNVAPVIHSLIARRGDEGRVRGAP